MKMKMGAQILAKFEPCHTYSKFYAIKTPIDFAPKLKCMKIELTVHSQIRQANYNWPRFSIVGSSLVTGDMCVGEGVSEWNVRIK